MDETYNNNLYFDLLFLTNVRRKVKDTVDFRGCPSLKKIVTTLWKGYEIHYPTKVVSFQRDPIVNRLKRDNLKRTMVL